MGGQTASDVVIWSADVDEDALLNAVLSGAGGLDLIKLDRLGLTKMGLQAIEWVQDRGFRVFADAKIVEIPDKSLALAKLHLAYRPWMLNCMAGIVSTADMTIEDEKKLDGLKRLPMPVAR